MKRHDPDMDPGGVQFQGVGIKGEIGEKAGNVLLGKRLSAPKPIREVRRVEPADAGPIENRAIRKINQYSGEF